MPSSTFDPGGLGYEAQAYASRGFTVFPLWHAAGGACACALGSACGRPGKHPRTRNGLADATSDLRRTDYWWAMWPDAGIGMPAGGNGLAVIDVDPRHGGDESLRILSRWLEKRHGIDLFATHLVRTGSGGLHLYYRQPPGGIISKAKAFGAPGLDTRGRGGYVILPPSMHVSGGRYQAVENRHGLAPWPVPLTAIMHPAQPDVSRVDQTIATRQLAARAGRDSSGWAAAGLARECDHLRGLTIGDRNVQLNHAAFKMGRRVGAGLLDEAAATEALYAAAAGWIGHECDEREIRNTIKSGMQAGKVKPHPGPAARDAGARP